MRYSNAIHQLQGVFVLWINFLEVLKMGLIEKIIQAAVIHKEKLRSSEINTVKEIVGI